MEMVNGGPIHWIDIDMYDVCMHGFIHFMYSVPIHPNFTLPINGTCPGTIYT